MHFEVGVRRSEIQSWLESQNPQYGRKEALLGQFLSVDRIENQARKNVLIAVAINKSLHKKVIDTYGSLARQGEFETELDFVFRCKRLAHKACFLQSVLSTLFISDSLIYALKSSAIAANISPSFR